MKKFFGIISVVAGYEWFGRLERPINVGQFGDDDATTSTTTSGTTTTTATTTTATTTTATTTTSPMPLADCYSCEYKWNSDDGGADSQGICEFITFYRKINCNIPNFPFFFENFHFFDILHFFRNFSKFFIFFEIFQFFRNYSKCSNFFEISKFF